MKKTYIIPEMETVKIETRQMLADSATIPTGSTPTDPGQSDARELFLDF